MAKLNLLTGGLDSSIRKPVAASEPPEAKHHEVMKAAMEALGEQLKQARGDLETSRGETVAERARAGRLQEALTAEAERRARATTELAAEQATSAGLRAQLETERQARVALSAPLEQAIAAAAKDPVIVQQAAPAEAPAYEVVVTNRDGNNRMRTLTLKPAAKG